MIYVNFHTSSTKCTYHKKCTSHLDWTQLIDKDNFWCSLYSLYEQNTQKKESRSRSLV